MVVLDMDSPEYSVDSGLVIQGFMGVMAWVFRLVDLVMAVGAAAMGCTVKGVMVAMEAAMAAKAMVVVATAVPLMKSLTRLWTITQMIMMTSILTTTTTTFPPMMTMIFMTLMM